MKSFVIYNTLLSSSFVVIKNYSHWLLDSVTFYFVKWLTENVFCVLRLFFKELDTLGILRFSC